MVIVDLYYYLVIATVLFVIGLFGIVVNRRSIIHILISIELILLAVNLNFIYFSVFLDDLKGLLFAIFILTIAAAESSIGLAILVAYFRVKGTVAVTTINLLQG